MQNELRSEYPDKPIQIIGVNEHGRESGNSLMTEGRTTPLLQDVDADNNGVSDVTYDLWDVTYRDVKIINQQNELVGTVNLTPPAGFDLSEQINYDALKQILADVAHERPFWQNPDEPTDVNDDERTSAVDALQCINELALGSVSGSEIALPLPMPPLMPTPYLDVNGDGNITAIDALLVINRLMEQSGTSESESIAAEGELLQVDGEAIRNAPDRLELTNASDALREGEQDDRVVDTNVRPLEATQNATAQLTSTHDADSSPLSCDSVDSFVSSWLFLDRHAQNLVRRWRG